MSRNIFCANCGKERDYHLNRCSCGFEMSISEKNEIWNKLQTINNSVVLDKSLEEETYLSFNDLIENHQLSSLYFTSRGAKKAFDKKVNFLRSDLIPKMHTWSDNIQLSDKNVALDKVAVYDKIISITSFVLKEFFGPFKIQENGLQVFMEFRDFGKYKISNTLLEADLDFSDIKTVNFASIGNDVINTLGKTLSTGSFKELSNKKEWTEADVRTLKAEVGVAVAGELISGISTMIGQTQKAIKNVRLADNELNKKIESVSAAINSLSIEEEEIEKQKRLFDKLSVILDTCFEKILRPIVYELNNDPVYIEYREQRRPLDLEQEKIGIDEELFNSQIKVSFWGCLLSTSAGNFKRSWNKRIRAVNKFDRYREINSMLNERNHKTLKDLNSYKNVKLEEYKEFERINRQVLNKRPVITGNAQQVLKFAGVLKEVKAAMNNA